MTADAVFRIVKVIGHKDVCIWKLDILDGYVPAINKFCSMSLLVMEPC